MKYATLQAVFTHHLADNGILDDNGNLVVPIGKIYDFYQEYRKAQGTDKKIEMTFLRLNLRHTLLPKRTLFFSRIWQKHNKLR